MIKILKLKKLFKITLISLILVSCSSPQKLIERALKKDPNIILCDSVDTFYRYLPGEKGLVLGTDSLIVNNNKLYIKVIGQGNISLNWELKPDTTQVIKTTPVIKPKKTNAEIRLNNKKEIKIEKEKTKQIQSDNKVKIKESKVIIKENNKNKLNWYILSFVLGFITCFLIKK